MSLTETQCESRPTLRREGQSGQKTAVPAHVAPGLATWPSAAIPLAAANGPDRVPAADRPLALNRRALLDLLGVRADHCGRSFFVWRSTAAAADVRGDATPLAGSDQQFAIAFVAGADACGAFQCEVTSRELGGEVSVWHAGARLVGEFILLSAHQEEEFNEFLRRLEAARAGGARYTEAAHISDGATRAIATTAPRASWNGRTATARSPLRCASPFAAEIDLVDTRRR